MLGIVVPCIKRGWPFFRPYEDIFIPFNNICKIGSDVILVELFCDAVRSCETCVQAAGDEKGEKIQEEVPNYDDYPTYSGKVK